MICLISILLLSFVKSQHDSLFLADYMINETLAELNETFQEIDWKFKSTDCQSRILNMVNHFLHDPSIEIAFMNSGKGLNQLGNYDDCKDANNSRYILLAIEGLPLVFNLGFCAPLDCEMDEYISLKEPLSKILNDLINSLKPPESEVNINITARNINFIDSYTQNTEGTKMKLSTLITLGVIAGFIFLSFLCSAIVFMVPNINEGNSAFSKIISSFDLANNLKIFAKTEERHDKNLKVFNGVRTLSMIWIVLGHSFMTITLAPVDNPDKVANIFNEFSKAHLYHAPLAVDVFFFLSGFLLAYILLSSKSVQIDWKLYLHRIIRLYPALLFAYVLYNYILPIFGDGPSFYRFIRDTEHCSEIVHYVFLFLHNFHPEGKTCIGWIWYLANDMQFFIISPPLIYLLKKYPKFGIYLILLIICGCYISTILVVISHEIYASYSRFHDDYNRYYYDKPWARIAPYLIGILLAYSYLQSKTNQDSFHSKLASHIKNSVVFRLVLYIVGLAGCFWTVQGLYWLNKYPNDYPRYVDTIYLVFRHSVFIVFLYILCMPAICGKGRILHMLFSNKLMEILAKLTYGVYMTHEGIMDFYIYSLKISVYSSYEVQFLWFLSVAVIGHLSSLFLHIFIESPVFGIEDAFLRKRRQPKNEFIEKVKEIEKSIVPILDKNSVDSEKLGLLSTKSKIMF